MNPETNNIHVPIYTTWYDCIKYDAPNLDGTTIHYTSATPKEDGDNPTYGSGGLNILCTMSIEAAFHIYPIIPLL